MIVLGRKISFTHFGTFTVLI
uniref:Uncharacterized protein n=1 Tax=Anguilla anguilla TaxID=7936 RepID=A0A0E9QU77_ANGAN